MNYDNDLFHELKLSKRKPLNLIHNLIGRELGTNSSTLGLVSTFSGYSNKNERTSWNHLKRIYLSITPNYTILNVKTPNCYLRRFSPDGRYLIAYNKDLNGIQIFLFKGSSSGLNDIERFSSRSFTTLYEPLIRGGHSPSFSSNQTSSNRHLISDKTDSNDYESDQFRFRAFDTYFKELANIKLTDNNEVINRECALFFKNSYLIVASSEMVNDDNLPPYDQMASNNESIHFGSIENYTIYLVDINEARLCDKLRFKADKLNLTHNQSLGLFKNVFTVLSQQNQTIYVYNIVPDLDKIKKLSDDFSYTSYMYSNKPKKITYKFVLVQQIGRFCYSDDSEFISASTHKPNQQSASSKNSINNTNVLSNNRVHQLTNRQRNFSNQQNPSQVKPFSELCFTSMKHRILTFFYKEALETNSLSEFYIYINSILNLKMYRMQLLDDRHILIKYVNADHMVNQKLNMPTGAIAAAAAAAAASTSANSLAASTTSASGINNPLNAATQTSASNPSTILSSLNSTINTGSASTPFVFTAGTNNLTNSSNVSSIPSTSNTTFLNSLLSNNNNSTPASNYPSGFLNANSTNLPVILNENSIPFYFVLYDMKSTRILNIMRNTSLQLLNAYENFQDFFTLSTLDNFSWDNNSNNSTSSIPFGSQFNFHTLPSNNVYARQTLQRHIKNISKFNNNTELTKCLLSHLPINSQSYTTTAYLDHNLFSYDEKLISNLERPKPIGDQIIKFNNRETGRLSFRLYSGLQTNTNHPHNHHASFKRLVAFIWHPREPFCISVQRASQEYNVNFHVYSKNNLI